MPKLTPRTSVFFRDQFRAARESAQQDAEAFDKIIVQLEKIGRFLNDGKGIGLAHYEDVIVALANTSPLGTSIPELWRNAHVPTKILFDLIRIARNSAMHEGVYARHLTQHCIQLSIVLEDALTILMDSNLVSDFMVRNPICAETWQPLSFARQNMLANSFTYLPVFYDGKWKIVSDLNLAAYLNAASSKGQRDKRMAQTLETAFNEQDGIALIDAGNLEASGTCNDALKKMAKTDALPILLVVDAEDHLLGLLTAFDLL